MATQLQYRATGRRKTSIARVRLLAGSGRIIVNDKPFDEYFPMASHQHALLVPLQTTGTEDQYDIIAQVQGGGPSGQAGAVQHGIARALVEAEADHRGVLKREGLLTRDSRKKERHKFGRKKARKSSQFSKR